MSKTPSSAKQNVSSYMKSGIKLVLMSTATCVLGMAAANAQDAVTSPANSWDYDVVLDGNVSKDVSVEGVTGITVDGGNGYVEGNADIYEGHTVNVDGINGAQGGTFAYRDNRDNIESTLDGALNSNMQIVVIDKDGVFFTDNAQIDVQGILATTGAIAVEDVMDGNDTLSIDNIGDGIVANFGTINVKDDAVFAANIVANGGTIVVANNGGRVLLASAEQIELARVGTNGTTEIDVAEQGLAINLGTIRVADAGLAAMVAPVALNAGVINAKMGTVAMASGDTVTIDMFGDGLVEIGVDGAIENAYLANAGEIRAAGGKVQITAQAAEGTLDEVINNIGIIDATHATVQGGTIILSAGENGDVVNAGRIATSEGGKIEIEAKNFIQEAFGIPVIIQPETAEFVLEQEPEQGVIPLPGIKPVSYPMMSSNGGDINITTTGNVELLDGSINAGGGNITIDNDGVFFSAGKSTLRTAGEGEIALRQNQVDTGMNVNDQEQNQPERALQTASATLTPFGFGTIQNAVDAVSNAGTGTNTISVGAGTYNETVSIAKDNIVLEGANAGLHGRAPSRGAESIIQRVGMTPGVNISGDNVTVDGFTINEGAVGVRVTNADNAMIVNNVITGQNHPSAHGTSFAGFATGDGVFVQNATGTSVNRNHILEVQDDGIHAVDVVDFTAFNNVINGADGIGDQGIAISGATGVTTISKNTITRARRDAIQLINVTGDSEVSDNLIFFAGRSGINLVDVDGTRVENNGVNFTDIGMDIFRTDNVTANINTIRGAQDGILLQQSEDTNLDQNVIFDSEEGIVIATSTRLKATDNDITATDNGIRYKDGVTNQHRSILTGNDIDAGTNGILIDGDMTGGSTINIGSGNNGNTIFAGETGIKLEGTITGARLLVNGSKIIAGENAVNINAVGDDGLAAIWFNEELFAESGSAVKIGSVNSGIDGGVTIAGNKVIDGGDAGIDIGAINNSTVAIVENNDIFGVHDGVRFDGGVTDSFVLIGEQDTFDQSVITGDFGNGIEFNHDIVNSQILIGAGGTATTASNAANSSYTTFTQDGAKISGGLNGIVFNGNIIPSVFAEQEIISSPYGANLIENSVIYIGQNDISGGVSGIDITANLYGETRIEIKENTNIRGGSSTGAIISDIEDSFPPTILEGETENFTANDSEAVIIDGNTFNAGQTNIRVINIENVTIEKNQITNTKNTNIDSINSKNISILNNTIVLNNDVEVASAFGEYILSPVTSVNIEGGDTESVIFQGNTITFPEVSVIGFSTASNLIGANFSAGAVDVSDTDNPNIFINQSVVPNTAMRFIGGQTTIVGETLGSTVFQGFEGDGNFYVRFENGTILDPVTNQPIVIDAQDVSFDGRVAADGLSPEQFDFIEERLFDADDSPIDGRGQIFEPANDPNVVVFEPEAAALEIENFEDFIPVETEETEQQQSSASVTVQGLPATGQDAAAANALNPQAGGDGADVAGIEPAAGGDESEEAPREVTCISDAVGAIATGSFTYSFGGTFEQSIAGQSRCAS